MSTLPPMELSDDTPQCVQVKEFILERIREGFWKIGQRMPTIRELSELTGCGLTPVNQAMVEIAREGYVERRAGHGTFLRSQTHRETTVGPFGIILSVGKEALSRHLVQLSHIHDLAVTTSSVFYRRKIQFFYLNLPQQLDYACSLFNKVQGMIHIGPASEKFLDRATNRNIPIVYLAMYNPPVEGLYVKGDFCDVLQQGAKILADHGHRNIGLIHSFPKPETSASLLFTQAFLGGLSDRNLPHTKDRVLHIGSRTVPCGAELKEYFMRKDRPSAVFCVGFERAKVVYDACALLDIRIPEDLSVMALTADEWYGENFSPPLSTLVNPVTQIVEQAVDLLIESSSVNASAHRYGVTVRPQLFMRGSVSNLVESAP